MAKLCIGDIPVGAMNWVVGPEIEKTKFGATIDTLLGDVDENGGYTPTLTSWHFDGSAIKKIQNYGLAYAFAHKNVKSVDLSNLEWVGAAGLMNTFDTNKISGRLNLSKLEYIGSSGLSEAFYNNEITSVDLRNLKKTLNSALAYAFRHNKVASIDLRNLITCGNACFQTTFYQNTPENGRVDVYLPADGSGWVTGAMPVTMWNNSPTITEIHFSAHSEAWVQNQTGYASKFGATNATIYFDL